MKDSLRMKHFPIHLIKVLMIILLVGSITSCTEEDDLKFGSLDINATMTWEGQPFILGEEYLTSSGSLLVEDFKFYLSNLKVTGDNEFNIPESYYLIRGNNETNTYKIRIPGIPVGAYNTITYGIGVDPIKNLSLDNEGDLDPTNQMAWNWDTGYKFLLLEGKLTKDDGEVIAVVYHIGFGENFRTFSDKVTISVSEESQVGVDLKIEVSELLKTPNSIVVEELNEVMFNKEDALLLVENYSDGMFRFE